MNAKLLQNKEFYIILFLFSFSLFLSTFKLGSVPLFNPDEGIHAEVAKRMVIDGDWVTSRFNGANFYDKPILYYWLNAVSFKLFGINEFAARFPAAVLGVLGVLLTYLLGKILYNRRTGFMGALILSVSFEYLLLSRLVIHDISLTFGIIVSFLLFCYGFLQNKIRKWAIPFFYVSLAWSVLAKGLIGLVLPGLIIGLFVFLRKEWGLLKEMRLGLGIIIFLCLVATWYVPVSLANRDFLSYFIFHQHLRQFLSSGARHLEPVYYYIPVFFGGFFPWSCFVPSAWYRTLSPAKSIMDRKADLFLVLWLSVMFVFFSIARAKLSTYILPIYPAAAIMVAKLWQDAIISTKARNREMLYSLLVPLIILIPGLIALTIYFPAYVYIGILLLSGIVLAFFCLYFKRSSLSFYLLAATSVITFLSLTAWVMPFFSHIYSTKDLSKYLKQASVPSDHIACYGRLQNSTVFYSDRAFKLIERKDDLIEFMNQKGKWFFTIKEKDYLKNENEITKRAKIIYREGKQILLTNKISPSSSNLRAGAPYGWGIIHRHFTMDKRVHSFFKKIGDRKRQPLITHGYQLTQRPVNLSSL